MPRISTARSAMCVTALLLTVGLSACTSKEKYPGYAETSSNVTPDTLSLHNRPVDANTDYAITTNENWRMFWADLGRASLLDRPSRLAFPPIPH